jgi:hypothetical protein
MSEAVNLEYVPVGCNLLGQVDYYRAILGRKDLVTKEGEFKISKLGLIIDLIKALDIPDELNTKLSSAIIDAWRLDAPERSQEERAEEMSYIMRSIEAIRSTVQWSKRHPGPEAAKMLDIAVIFSLPIMNSDLNTTKIGQIHDLLGQIVDHLSKADQNNLQPCCK